MYGKQL